VLVYAVIAGLAVLALLLALPLLRRNARLDDVDRFHVARSLTTAWSSQPPPHTRVPAEGEDLTEDPPRRPTQRDRLRPPRRDGGEA
jgi:hypothetical protein